MSRNTGLAIYIRAMTEYIFNNLVNVTWMLMMSTQACLAKSIFRIF